MNVEVIFVIAMVLILVVGTLTTLFIDYISLQKAHTEHNKELYENLKYEVETSTSLIDLKLEASKPNNTVIYESIFFCEAFK